MMLFILVYWTIEEMTSGEVNTPILSNPEARCVTCQFTF